MSIALYQDVDGRPSGPSGPSAHPGVMRGAPSPPSTLHFGLLTGYPPSDMSGIMRGAAWCAHEAWCGMKRGSVVRHEASDSGADGRTVADGRLALTGWPPGADWRREGCRKAHPQKRKNKTVYCQSKWNTICVLDLLRESSPSRPTLIRWKETERY